MVREQGCEEVTWQGARGLGLGLGQESGSVVRVPILPELCMVSYATLVAHITTSKEACFSQFRLYTEAFI